MLAGSELLAAVFDQPPKSSRESVSSSRLRGAHWLTGVQAGEKLAGEGFGFGFE